MDNSLLDLHNFSDYTQPYPITDNYNDIDNDDDNNNDDDDHDDNNNGNDNDNDTDIDNNNVNDNDSNFNKSIHAIHEFKNFLVLLCKLHFG